jgi:CheY-like chemotaxis protein
MTAILVVDDEAPVRAEIARNLTSMGFDVHAVATISDALRTLRSESIDVVLSDLYMPAGSGTDLVRRLQEAAFDTPTILMSAFLTPREHETASQLGVVRVIDKPFSEGQLRAAVHEALERRTGFRGSIHGLSLVDFLQMLHYARRSATVVVHGTTRGFVHIDGGEFVGAECNGEVGEAALSLLLSTPSGAVQTSALVEAPRTLLRPFQETLLEALRLMDEAAAAGETAKVKSMRPRDTVPPDTLRRFAEAAAEAADASERPAHPEDLLPPHLLRQLNMVRVDEGWDEDDPQTAERPLLPTDRPPRTNGG